MSGFATEASYYEFYSDPGVYDIKSTGTGLNAPLNLNEKSGVTYYQLSALTTGGPPGVSPVDCSQSTPVVQVSSAIPNDLADGTEYIGFLPGRQDVKYSASSSENGGVSELNSISQVSMHDLANPGDQLHRGNDTIIDSVTSETERLTNFQVQASTLVLNLNGVLKITQPVPTYSAAPGGALAQVSLTVVLNPSGVSYTGTVTIDQSGKATGTGAFTYATGQSAVGDLLFTIPNLPAQTPLDMTFMLSTEARVIYTYAPTSDGDAFAGYTLDTLFTKVNLSSTEALINAVLTAVRADPTNSSANEGQVASQALSAVIDARHGFYGSAGQFAFLSTADPNTLANMDHYFTAYSAGLPTSGSGGLIQGLQSGASAIVVGSVLDIGYNACKSLFGNCFPVDSGAQSAPNWDFWAFSGASAAIKVLTAQNLVPSTVSPVGGVDTDPSQSIYLNPGSTTPLVLDPAYASAYEYQVLSGPGIKSVTVPSASVPGVSIIHLLVNGQLYAIAPDQTFDFTALSGLQESGVTGFLLYGLGHPTSPGDFESSLTFVSGDPGSLLQQALSFSDNTGFVTLQYERFLDRIATQTDVGDWVNQLTQGLTAAQLVQIFINSDELAVKGKFVVCAYLGILGRDADYNGFRYWLSMLENSHDQTQVADGLLQSVEFTSNFGASLDNGQFVTRMYENALRREPDADGLAYWTGLLDSGTDTRAQVALGFLYSSEFQSFTQLQNRAIVSLLYFDMLQRQPDVAGFSGWVGALDSGAQLTDVITLFLNSGEYANTIQ